MKWRHHSLTFVLPAFNTPRRRSLTRYAGLCLGLAPLTLYLAALTLVPVISTLLLSLQTPQGEWGLGAYRAIIVALPIR